MDAFRLSKNGKPKLLIAKTIIGKGIDEVAGTNAAHGAPSRPLFFSLPQPLNHREAPTPKPFSLC
jgi:hypothetical protein